MANTPQTSQQGSANIGQLNITNGPNAIIKVIGAGVPTDGTSGTKAGEAGPGSEYTDVTNAKLYINTGTKASPTWTVVGTQS